MLVRHQGQSEPVALRSILNTVLHEVLHGSLVQSLASILGEKQINFLLVFNK